MLHGMGLIHHDNANTLLDRLVRVRHGTGRGDLGRHDDELGDGSEGRRRQVARVEHRTLLAKACNKLQRERGQRRNQEHEGISSRKHIATQPYRHRLATSGRCNQEDVLVLQSERL